MQTSKANNLQTGGALQDDLILKDIGIGSGTTIRASLKTVQKPKLVILIGYDNYRPFYVMDNLEPIKVKQILRI